MRRALIACAACVGLASAASAGEAEIAWKTLGLPAFEAPRVLPVTSDGVLRLPAAEAPPVTAPTAPGDLTDESAVSDADPRLSFDTGEYAQPSSLEQEAASATLIIETLQARIILDGPTERREAAGTTRDAVGVVANLAAVAAVR